MSNSCDGHLSGKKDSMLRGKREKIYGLDVSVVEKNTRPASKVLLRCKWLLSAQDYFVGVVVRRLDFIWPRWMGCHVRFVSFLYRICYVPLPHEHSHLSRII